MSKTFLDRVYDIPEDGDTRNLYAEWAASYEADLTANGYATPRRIAEALARFAPDPAQPLLDYGCGTGLSGDALAQAGFTCIDGLDVTPEMLDVARGKGVYRNILLADPDAAPPVPPGSYPMIVAAGVIGVGAAPLSVFDDIMQILDTGGMFAFSFNDHALERPEYEAKLNEWLDSASAHLKMREHGPHIAAKDIGANVYVLEKA